MAIGRPKVDLPANAEELVYKWAFAGSSDTDIATMFGVGKSTVKRNFGPVLAKARARRRLEIATLQMKFAQKGVPAILIFLGKQAPEKGGLGQRDEMAFGGKEDVKKMSDEELESIAAGRARPHLKVTNGGKK